MAVPIQQPIIPPPPGTPPPTHEPLPSFPPETTTPGLPQLPGGGQMSLTDLIKYLQGSVTAPQIPAGASDDLAKAYLAYAGSTGGTALQQAIALQNQQRQDDIRQAELFGADSLGTPTDAAQRWRKELESQKAVQEARLKQQLIQLMGKDDQGNKTLEGQTAAEQAAQKWAELSGIGQGGAKTLAATAQEAAIAAKNAELTGMTATGQKTMDLQRLQQEAQESDAERQLKLKLQSGQLNQQESEFARNYLIQQADSRQKQAALSGYLDNGALTEDARAKRAAEALSAGSLTGNYNGQQTEQQRAAMAGEKERRAQTAASLTNNSKDVFKAANYFRNMQGQQGGLAGALGLGTGVGFTTSAQRAQGTPGTIGYDDIDQATGNASATPAPVDSIKGQAVGGAPDAFVTNRSAMGGQSAPMGALANATSQLGTQSASVGQGAGMGAGFGTGQQGSASSDDDEKKAGTQPGGPVGGRERRGRGMRRQGAGNSALVEQLRALQAQQGGQVPSAMPANAQSGGGGEDERVQQMRALLTQQGGRPAGALPSTDGSTDAQLRQMMEQRVANEREPNPMMSALAAQQGAMATQQQSMSPTMPTVPTMPTDALLSAWTQAQGQGAGMGAGGTDPYQSALSGQMAALQGQAQGQGQTDAAARWRAQMQSQMGAQGADAGGGAEVAARAMGGQPAPMDALTSAWTQAQGQMGGAAPAAAAGAAGAADPYQSALSGQMAELQRQLAPGTAAGADGWRAQMESQMGAQGADASGGAEVAARAMGQPSPTQMDALTSAWTQAQGQGAGTDAGGSSATPAPRNADPYQSALSSQLAGMQGQAQGQMGTAGPLNEAYARAASGAQGSPADALGAASAAQQGQAGGMGSGFGMEQMGSAPGIDTLKGQAQGQSDMGLGASTGSDMGYGAGKGDGSVQQGSDDENAMAGTQPGGPVGGMGRLVSPAQQAAKEAKMREQLNDPKVKLMFKQMSEHMRATPGSPAGMRPSFSGAVEKDRRAVRGLAVLQKRGIPGMQPGGPVTAPAWPTDGVGGAGSDNGGSVPQVPAPASVGAPPSAGGSGSAPPPASNAPFAQADVPAMDAKLNAFRDYLTRFGVQGLGAQALEAQNATDKGVTEGAFAALGLNPDDAMAQYAQSRFANGGNALTA